jgi:hypothetical protein
LFGFILWIGLVPIGFYLSHAGATSVHFPVRVITPWREPFHRQGFVTTTAKMSLAAKWTSRFPIGAKSRTPNRCDSGRRGDRRLSVASSDSMAVRTDNFAFGCLGKNTLS